jgi:transposase
VARADRAEWAKRVQRWQESGLTAREFAHKMGLRPASLSFWKWRLKKGHALVVEPAKRAPLVLPNAPKTVRFVELTAPADAHASCSRRSDALGR